MELEKIDLSYFDYYCERYGFMRNFIHYLAPSEIEIIILMSTPNLSKKDACSILNDSEERYMEYTVPRLTKKLRIIKFKLIELKIYANAFGIEKTIKPMSLVNLNEIILNYKKDNQ